MNLADILRSLFEVCLVVFTFWGILHEDRFIAFEEKLFCRIRRKRIRISETHKSPKIVKYNFGRQ